MEYYHNLVTQKSWRELQNLRRLADFILIGGWAVYLYTKALKSKDIDIIIDYAQLPLLGKHYLLTKNDRLKKYEAIKEAVQIDIYLPHYSRLGLPVEDLILQAQTYEGFKLLAPDYLAALKIVVLNQRGRSPKGQKDLLDFLSLFISGKTDLKKIKAIADRYSLANEIANLKTLLGERQQISELDLNPHAYAKVKRELLGSL